MRFLLSLGACATDADHDGFAKGPDCDDSDASVFPGAGHDFDRRAEAVVTAAVAVGLEWTG